MISAKEARKLAGVDKVKEHLEWLEKRITLAAQNGKTEIIIREDPYASWLYNSHSPVGIGKQVVDVLRAEGFNVTQHYEEKQFVDLGLKITWAW